MGAMGKGCTMLCSCAAPAGLVRAHLTTLMGAAASGLPSPGTAGRDTITGTCGRPLQRHRLISVCSSDEAYQKLCCGVLGVPSNNNAGSRLGLESL